MSKMDNHFFSISFDLVLLDQRLPYDLYVNSSAHEERERFVRIYPKGDSLTDLELKLFKNKYFQLYVHESQRQDYLKSLILLANASTIQKTEVIKDSAIHYLDKIFNEDREFSTEILTETILECKIAVEQMVEVVKDLDVSGIQNLIASLSFHDFYTYDHSINVSMYCIALYSALNPNAPKSEIVQAGLGGLLHDIGKIKIPTELINKPDRLSESEFAEIKKHPELGFSLLTDKPCACEGIDLQIIKRVVHEHHENFNGTGYPNNLDGADIHLLARITTIADFFDALTTKRSYHEILSTEDAIAVMEKSVGKKLDPKLFAIFTANIKQLIWNGKINQELPEEFDPCQPQNVLPFKSPEPTFKVKGFTESRDSKNFGKIKKKVS